MRLKIIFIFNTNHVKEHFSHLDNWCTGAREYVNSIGQSSGENENIPKKSFKRGKKKTRRKEFRILPSQQNTESDYLIRTPTGADGNTEHTM